MLLSFTLHLDPYLSLPLQIVPCTIKLFLDPQLNLLFAYHWNFVRF